ncbi:MAG: hypothetical protein ACJ72A_10050 [Nocardioidaceae bacterium]|jgi:hypothetical protein
MKLRNATPSRFEGERLTGTFEHGNDRHELEHNVCGVGVCLRAWRFGTTEEE